MATSPGSLFTTDIRGYRALLSRQMELATWVKLPFWSQFMGFIGSKGKYPESINFGAYQTKYAKPTGKPIEVLTNFMTEGSATMDIPILYPLIAAGIYGGNTLLGTEEARKFAYKTLSINVVRKGALLRTNAMDEQVLKKPEMQRQLMESAQGDLTDWFQRWNSFQPYLAFCTRYSDNLTAATASGGLAKTKQSHPNFYVAGSPSGTTNGKVTWSDTAATYEGYVATALNGLSNASQHYFSTKVIDNMLYTASKLKIRPIDLGNGTFHYAIVIHPSQALQLKNDTKWVQANQYAGPRTEDANRLFTGNLLGVYAGAMIYVDINSPSVKIYGDDNFTVANATVPTGTTLDAGVQYGADNPLANPIEDSNKKLAILFGQSAVGCGYASPLKFEQETWDYNAKKSEGGQMIVGYERSDIYDIDGNYGTAGLFKENTSSLVCATWSPDNVAWTN